MAARPDPKSSESSPYESVSPNSVSDQPTADDSLGFGPYVQAVCDFLLNRHTQPPLTLSVEGTWGSGKSSFMYQLKDRIDQKAKEAKKNGKPKGNPEEMEVGGKTVWFNAWRHDRDDELWAAFALVFTNQLARDLTPWKKWLLHLKLSYHRFDKRRGWFQLAKFLMLAVVFLAFTVIIGRHLLRGDGSTVRELLSTQFAQLTLFNLLLGVGGPTAYVLSGMVLIRQLAEVVGNPFKIQLTEFLRDPNYEARAAFLETFHSDFERLIEVYSEGQRIFVFVDDLDRCDVPRAAELMQAINLLISESNRVVYILGLDREKVAAGLAAKYANLLPYLSSKSEQQRSDGITGSEFGYNFLEKFIQIPFLMPQPTESDIDKLLDSLNKTPKTPVTDDKAQSDLTAGLLVELSTDSDSVRKMVKMVAPSFDYNPRRLKQFVNLFRLRALIASRTGLFGEPRDSNLYDRLTFEQLAKLVAIALRWPLFLVDVENDLTLLGHMQAHAWKEIPSTMSFTGPFQEGGPIQKYWEGNPKLMQLIAFCGSDDPDSDQENAKKKYSLSRIDLQRFLQVSPVVQGREEYAGHEGANSGEAPRDTDQTTAQSNTSNRENTREPSEQSRHTPKRRRSATSRMK